MEGKQTKRPWSINADDSLQDALERQDCPTPLRRTLTGALSWQARNETSIRRSLTSPRTATQWLATLLALGATVTVEEDDGQTRQPGGQPQPLGDGIDELEAGPGGPDVDQQHLPEGPAVNFADQPLETRHGRDLRPGVCGITGTRLCLKMGC